MHRVFVGLGVVAVCSAVAALCLLQYDKNMQLTAVIQQLQDATRNNSEQLGWLSKTETIPVMQSRSLLAFYRDAPGCSVVCNVIRGYNGENGKNASCADCPPGPVGNAGPQGERGFNGTSIAGPPGRDGLNGSQGERGFNGSSGAAGETGAKGDAGRNATDGRNGTDYYLDISTKHYFVDDFVTDLSAAGYAGLGWGLSGSNFIGSDVASTGADVGTFKLATSATNVGRTASMSLALGMFAPAFGDISVTCRVWFPSVANTAVRIGLFDGAIPGSADPVNGAWFEFNTGVYGTTIQGRTSRTSTRSTTPLQPLVASTWYWLKFTLNQTTVSFYINNVYKGAITTNIPNQPATRINPAIGMVNIAAVVTAVHIDVWEHQLTLYTPR